MSRKHKRAAARARQKRGTVGLRRRESQAAGRPAAMQDKLERALSCHQAGRLAEADRLYTEILAKEPEHADALNLLGVVRLDEGDAAAAAELIEKAIAVNPDHAEAHCNLGVALTHRGELEAAVAAYRRAVTLKPDFAQAYYNLGVALGSLGQVAEAVSACRKVVELNPNHAQAHNNLGGALRYQGEMAAAAAAYRRAVALRPGYAEAYFNLGIVLNDQGKRTEAAAAYREAVKLKPDFVEARSNLGRALCELGEFEEAAALFRGDLARDPDDDIAQAMLVFALQRICDWQGLEAAAGRMDELIDLALDQHTRPAETPFVNLSRCNEAPRNLAIAKAWSEEVTGRMSDLEDQLPASIQRPPGEKIRIGYLSGDFRDHAMAHLTVSVYGLHDRERFEISAYSYGPDDGSDYRKRIAEGCDNFVDIREWSDIDAARRIRKDGIDILVDLKGHTVDARLEICALRPAPVQAAYLGFPGSSGAEFFDYVLTDRIVTPEDQAAYYTEKFVYLPHCYQVNDHTLEISDRPLRRADFALPEEGFVFCSFNQSYKLEPVMWEVWMAILRSVPGAVLWLYCRNETARRNLGREAAERGVDPERIVFAETLPKPEHLARLGLADLFLDTRVYNAHTTASDALWAGVPLITLQGSHFVSRVASSLLTAIGLPELITHGLDDYQALAVRLARDRAVLAALRKKLSQNRLSEPLFDTPRFARGLEQAYLMMWQLHAAGEPPRRLEVVEPR